MKKYTWFFVIITLLCSCNSYKRFTYLQPNKPSIDTIYKPAFTLYKLQPGDLLYINVLSLDKNVTELFNSVSTGTSPTLGTGGQGMFLIGHSIDKDGFIQLPVLGSIHVAALGIDDATKLIQSLAVTYIKDAKVEVKLVSFKISLLGEVNHPGQITIYNDRANILEAISLGGDVTYYGNRRNILIVRTISDGVKTINIDLTKRNILKSEQFYLQPNDVIYVEPLKTAAFRLRVADFTVLLTLLTSSITAVFLIIKVGK
jgi:polysaccharide biosynthesis/export protein